jgi:hypothetical protein
MARLSSAEGNTFTDLPDGRYSEATPADPIFFFFGVSLGVPIYGGLTYAVLCLTTKTKNDFLTHHPNAVALSTPLN